MATANALTLTGSGSALRISSIAGLAGKLTLEAWIKPTAAERRAVLSIGDANLYLVLAAGNGEVSALAVANVASVGGGIPGAVSLTSGINSKYVFALCAGGGGAVKQGEWSHVALTIAAGDGQYTVAAFHQGKQVATATIRNNGAQLAYYTLLQHLLRSHLLESCTLGAPVAGVPGFAGAISEARLWSDALAPADLAARRITRARGDEPGLIGCYRLERIAAGCMHDLSPRRGFAVAGSDASTGAAIGLPLPPTVSADQLCVLGRGKLGREWVTIITPAHDVHITPITGQGFTQHLPEQVSNHEERIFDATLEVHAPDGTSRAGASFEVRIDRAMDQLVDAGHQHKRVPWQPGKSYFVTVPASGRARLRFIAGDLVCPLVRVRIDGMADGLWTAVRPDGAAHDKLRHVTSADLLKPADGRPSPMPAGAVADDASALADTLSLLGRALPPTTKVRSALDLVARGQVRSLSWGDVGDTFEDGYHEGGHLLDEGIDGGKDVYDEGKDALVAGTGQAVKTVTDSSGKAVQVLVATGQDGVKGATTASKAAGALVARGGTALDDLKRKAASAPAQLGAGAIHTFIDSADQLAVLCTATSDQIARSMQVIGTSIVNGTTVAWRVVVAGVEDAIAAAGAVIRKVGAAIEKFLDYLAYLFRWQDFLAASDRFMTSYEDLLAKLPGYVGTLFDSQQQLVNRLTSSIDAGVAGQSIAQLCGVDVTSSSPGVDELEYVMDYLDRVLSSAELTVERAAAEVSPALAEATKVAMAAAADSTMSAMPYAKFANGVKVFTSPVSELLGGAHDAASSSTSIIDYLYQSLRDTTTDTIAAAVDPLKKHLYVPYLTPMIEKSILGGRQLSVLRITALVAGIGSVLATKISDSVQHGSISDRSVAIAQPRSDSSSTSGSSGSTTPATPPKDWAWGIMGCGMVATVLTGVQTAVELSQIGKAPSEAVEWWFGFLTLGIGALTVVRSALSARVLPYTSAALRPYAITLTALEGVSGLWLGLSAVLRRLKKVEKEWQDKVDAVVLGLIALADLATTFTALGTHSVQGDRDIGEFSARSIATFSGALMRGWSAADNIGNSTTMKKITCGLMVVNFFVEIGEAAYGDVQEAPV